MELLQKVRKFTRLKLLILTFSGVIKMKDQNKAIFDNYKFLGLQPFKIDCCLGVIAFATLIILMGWDLKKTTGLALGTFLMIVNALIIVEAVCYIAYMRETAYKEDIADFNYRKSLRLTRFLQKELAVPINASQFNNKVYGQKDNNRLRLLSFVAVFKGSAYIFIRLPHNVSSRREMEEYKAIANDIADELGLSPSSLQRMINKTNLGLGHVNTAVYQVMRLSK